MVKAYMPLPKFPSISITGSKCSLKCKFCEGKVLNEMVQINRPEELLQLLRHLKRKRRIVGCLISGGFDRKGKLPIRPYLKVLKEAKKELDIIISVHTGIVCKEYAEKLRDANIDIVDFNLQDPLTMREIMGLNYSWEEIENSITVLYDYGPPYIAPHILIGAYYGRKHKEEKLIDLISKFKPYILVLLSLVNVKGTAFENISPPTPEEVYSIFKYARRKLNCELALGCMRPRGRYSEKLEKILLQEKLVDRIVLPSCMENEKLLPFCCSLPEELERKIISEIDAKNTV